MLLDLVDAVTVHPYRQSPPETAARDILRLRALISKYRPDRPDLSVISGEWGYSVAWSGYSRGRQGRYLPRQFLTNLSLGIPVSIWYDWHDDGRDPKEPEHNFGTVTIGREAKPAYRAMQRLVEALGRMRFVKRLQSGEEDWFLLFTGRERRTVAAWTIGIDTGASFRSEPSPATTVSTREAPFLRRLMSPPFGTVIGIPRNTHRSFARKPRRENSLHRRHKASPPPAEKSGLDQASGSAQVLLTWQGPQRR